MSLSTPFFAPKARPATQDVLGAARWPQHSLHRTVRGFTLIELMIVVAILGILASVVYPAYTDSITKGRRAQARAALTELMQQQERYMTQRNCYLAFTTNAAGVATPSAPSPATACGGITATSVPFKTFAGESLAHASYLLSASTCSAAGGTTLSIAQCVQVTATPRQTDAAVANLSLTSTGTKSCTGTAATTKPQLCWP